MITDPSVIMYIAPNNEDEDFDMGSVYTED